MGVKEASGRVLGASAGASTGQDVCGGSDRKGAVSHLYSGIDLLYRRLDLDGNGMSAREAGADPE